MKDTDRNYHSIADRENVRLQGMRLDPSDEGEDPMAYDDTLKFSHARGVDAQRLWIRGGSENAVDMNRECRAIRLRDCMLISGAQCAVVIKGGAEDIELYHIRIAPGPRPTRWDIELGGWSDQSQARTTRVRLTDVERTDGKPVRVVCGHADRPTIVGGRVRVLFWWSLALKLFIAARRLQSAIANRKSKILP